MQSNVMANKRPVRNRSRVEYAPVDFDARQQFGILDSINTGPIDLTDNIAKAEVQTEE